MLQQQNDDLDTQRVKLLKQLRVNAEQMSAKVRDAFRCIRRRSTGRPVTTFFVLGFRTQGLKYYGLTGDQMFLLNEYAERLRTEGQCCCGLCVAYVVWYVVCGMWRVACGMWAVV